MTVVTATPIFSLAIAVGSRRSCSAERRWEAYGRPHGRITRVVTTQLGIGREVPAVWAPSPGGAPSGG